MRRQSYFGRIKEKEKKSKKRGRMKEKFKRRDAKNAARTSPAGKRVMKGSKTRKEKKR